MASTIASPPPARRLWQIPTFVLGLTALAIVAACPSAKDIRLVRGIERDLVTVRQGLAGKEADVAQLLSLANEAVARTDHAPHLTGAAHLALGAVYIRQSESAPDDQATKLRRQALDHLEMAETRGVPSSDNPRLLFQLADALCKIGDDIPRAVTYLRSGGASGADNPVAGYALLVQACLRLPTPDVDAALAANQRVLNLGTDPTQIMTAQLIGAELLLKRNQPAEALRLLEKIGPSAPAKMLAQVRLIQALSLQEESQWASAAKLWKELLAHPEGVPGGKARIFYALGCCQRNAEPPELTASAESFQQAVACGGEVGQAAALLLAELRLGGPNAGEALTLFERALENVQKPDDYHNALIDLARARELMENGLKAFQAQGDLLSAQKLAVLYRKVARGGAAEDFLAQVVEAEAAELAARAAQRLDANPAQVEAQSRLRFQEAASLYVTLAQSGTAAEKVERLWKAIDCSVRGQDHPRALALLRQWLALELPTERQAEGLFTLACVFRINQQYDQAAPIIDQCLKLPENSFTFKVSHLAALVEIEQKNYDKGEAILHKGLARAAATGDQEARSQLLFTLADVYYLKRDYDKAVARYKEATSLYQGSPRALSARDQLGDCYRQLAERYARTLASPDTQSGLKQENLCSKSIECLELARDVYQEIADELQAKSSQLKESKQKLPTTEEVMLRRAQFSVAQCYFDLPDAINTLEALRRYQILADRYPGQTDMLLACQKAKDCLDKLREMQTSTNDLRVAVTIAHELFKNALEEVQNPQRMPDALFVRMGGTSVRTDWQRWLDGQVNSTKQR